MEFSNQYRQGNRGPTRRRDGGYVVEFPDKLFPRPVVTFCLWDQISDCRISISNLAPTGAPPSPVMKKECQPPILSDHVWRHLTSICLMKKLPEQVGADRVTRANDACRFNRTSRKRYQSVDAVVARLDWPGTGRGGGESRMSVEILYQARCGSWSKHHVSVHKNSDRTHNSIKKELPGASLTPPRCLDHGHRYVIENGSSRERGGSIGASVGQHCDPGHDNTRLPADRVQYSGDSRCLVVGWNAELNRRGVHDHQYRRQRASPAIQSRESRRHAPASSKKTGRPCPTPKPPVRQPWPRRHRGDPSPE